MFAILPNGGKVPPNSKPSTLFHGTNLFPAAAVRLNGLPIKGSDWRIVEHLQGNSNSAFRGCTPSAIMQVPYAGAAFWAGDGGWVYELSNLDSWYIPELLDHFTPIGGYSPSAWSPYPAECESAVSSEIKASRVVRVFEVFSGRIARNGEIRLRIREC
jgi:hypothetical protein